MVLGESVMSVIRVSCPSFRNNADKVAFVVHSSLRAAGFVLTAIGQTAFAADVITSSLTDEIGIEHWNDLHDEYEFVYFNPEKNVMVKCLAMGDKLVVDGLPDGAGNIMYLLNGYKYNLLYRPFGRTIEEPIYNVLVL